MTSILDAALRYLDAGISVVPVGGDKLPTIGSWKHLQRERMTEGEARQHFSNGAGIGVIGGRVSGGLCFFDFDAPGFFELWGKLVEDEFPDLISSMPVTQTPKGYGRHVAFRVEDPLEGKEDLAWVEKGKIAIELRGGNHYTIEPPSRKYEHLSGPFLEEAPLLPMKTFARLREIAMSLTRYVEPEHHAREGDAKGGGGSQRPGDDFNKRGDLAAVLLEHGWDLEREVGETSYWRRPGKDDGTWSATLGHVHDSAGNPAFYVFSSNGAPFQSGRLYSKFSAYALLEHAGDFREAAHALGGRGFGEQGEGAASPEGGGEEKEPQDLSHLIYRPPPLECLPDVVRLYVTAVAGALSVDPATVLLPLLSLMGAAIGTTRAVDLKGSWREYSVVWSAILGESGTGKTPALAAVLQLLDPLKLAADRAWREALQEYESEKRRHDVAVKNFERGKGDDPGLAPGLPPRTRYTISDVTSEAVARVLNANPRGVLLAMDEMAGWLDFGRYRGGKSPGAAAPWLSAWSAKAWEVDRVGRGETLISRAAVSVTGGIQPAILQRALEDGEGVENGLLARLLLTWPPAQPRPWSEATIPRLIEANMTAVVRRLHDLAHEDVEDGCCEPVALPLGKEAYAVWVREYNAHEAETRDLAGVDSARESKIRSYAARVALVLELARDPAAREVSVWAVAGGWSLARWCASEARRVYALALGQGPRLSPELAKLLEWIQGRQDGCVAVRDVVAGPRRYRLKGGATLAEEHLEALVAANIGAWEDVPPGPEGGRPGRRFRLAQRGSGSETTEFPEEFDSSAAAATAPVSKMTFGPPAREVL